MSHYNRPCGDSGNNPTLLWRSIVCSPRGIVGFHPHSGRTRLAMLALTWQAQQLFPSASCLVRHVWASSVRVPLDADVNTSAPIGIRQLISTFCDGYPTEMVISLGNVSQHQFLNFGAIFAIFFIEEELFSPVFLFPGFISCCDFFMLTNLLVFSIMPFYTETALIYFSSPRSDCNFSIMFTAVVGCSVNSALSMCSGTVIGELVIFVTMILNGRLGQTSTMPFATISSFLIACRFAGHST